MKKNTFLWILLAVVVFFFVFGMGKSVYEGFAGETCTLNSQCPHSATNCGVCTRNGTCGTGMKRSILKGSAKCPGHSSK